MKSFFRYLMLFSFSVLLFVGCDKDDGASSDVNGLVGTWLLTQVEMNIMGQSMTYPANLMGLTIRMTFNANGSYSTVTEYDGDTNTETGTWSTSGNRITATSSSGDTGTMTYTISGSTLTMVSEDGFDGEYGDGQATLTFIRQ